MTKDFSKYNKVIEKFRGKVLTPNFEVQFTEATKSIVKTERFLLKMELKRLAQPCVRLIDLRGLVDGECRGYEYNGRTHYLDDIAIQVFEDSIAQYKGYTIGAFEATTNTKNNFRVIHQREKVIMPITAIETPVDKIIEKKHYPASRFSFGPYFNRCEERMNFAISFEVAFVNQGVFECVSSDISGRGCKFRLKSAKKVLIGEEITIRFIGLEQEYEFGGIKTFSYLVRNVQHLDGVQLIGAEREFDVDKQKDSFYRFLSGFIQGNKRRYKINLDNTISALKARTFEQFLLPKINELPVFLSNEFEGGNDGLTAKYALTCHDNRLTYEYWQDEKKQSTLHYLLSPERRAQLLSSKKQGKKLIVYSFVHQAKGQSYFYTADQLQLIEHHSFSQQFLTFAASKPSFGIFQLSLIECEHEHAYSPLTLADSIEKKDVYLNDKPSKDVTETLAQLPYIVVINELTSPSLVKQYQGLLADNIDTEKLKIFGHKRIPAKISVVPVGINYNNQRKEPRFYYKTPVSVEADKVKWQGKSHDFSVSGMKIELEKPAILRKGEIVYLTFPNLQKITSSFELASLPYEVMRINKAKTIINLRIYVEQHKHIGRSFFKLLIEKNKAKLTADEYVMMTAGLAKSLRNVYSRSMLSMAVAIQTSGSRYKFDAFTASVNNNNELLAMMKETSNQEGKYNLYPLLSHNVAINFIGPELKQLQSNDKPVTEELYIAFDEQASSIENAIVTMRSMELVSAQSKKIFIQNAIKKGRFFCVQIKLFRVDKPDLKYLNPELSYVSAYAIHRGKVLEQDVYSVAGMVQFSDISEEAIIRYKF